MFFRNSAALAVWATLLNPGAASAESHFVDLYTGTSNYTIPIVTPPSTNGMGPNLSLQYNSGSNTEWLGDGWNLQGLGSIVRRGPNYGSAPTYTSSDTFVLQLGGSQKLVYTGKDLAGIAGNYYHTEIENFMRIEFVSASNSWLVTDKNGTRYYFGQTSASQHKNFITTNQIFRWYLDKVMDTHGVFWTVTYDNGWRNADMPLRQIVYSQGAGLACTPVALASCRTIDFDTDLRPDTSPSFWSGEMFSFEFRRLKNITVKLGGKLVRRYALEYRMSPALVRGLDSVSQLASVQEYGANGDTVGAIPLPATKFAYKVDLDGTLNLTQQSMGGSPPEALGGPFTGTKEARECTHMVDFNGDGLPDVLVGMSNDYRYYQNLGNGNFGPKVPINQGFTLPSLCNIRKEEITVRQTDLIARFLNRYVWRQSQYYVVGERISAVHDARVLDIDGDGYPDILFQPVDGGSWTWSKGDGTSFIYGKTLVNAPTSHNGVNFWLNSPVDWSDPRASTFTDMDGDGLVDIVHLVRTGFTIAPGSPYTTASAYDIPATWDIKWWRNLGKGVFSVSPFVWHATSHTNYPNGSPAGCAPTLSKICNYRQAPANIALMDINNDGLPDFVFLSHDAAANKLIIQYYASQGAAGYSTTLSQVVVYPNGVDALGTTLDLFPYIDSAEPLTFSNMMSLKEYQRFVDVNGDGLVDILIGKSGNYVYFPGIRHGVGSFGAPLALTGSPPLALTRDHNMEFLTVKNDGYPGVLQGNASAYANYTLDHSRNHKKLETITNSLGGETGFKYERLRSANTINWVTNYATTNDGIGGSSATNYLYGAGKQVGWPHFEFRGYESVYERKGATAFKLVNFHQDDALKGRVVGVVEGSEYQNGASNSFDTTTSYSYATSTANGVTRVELGSEQVQGYKKDGVLATKSTAYGNYDAYGNPRLVTVTGDGVATRVTATDYVYNAANYIVNHPSRTEMRIGSTTGTKISETWFDYDGLANGVAPTLGDLTRETRWFSSGVNPITQFAYDAAGNRIGMIDAKVNTCAVTGYTNKTVYDTTYQAYPISETNAQCQTTSKNYWGVNNALLSAANVAGSYSVPGLLASVTDLNGVRTDSYWDALGRAKASVVLPDTATSPTTQWSYGVTGTAPSSTSRFDREVVGGGTLDSVTYNDGLGRPIQTERESELAGQWVTQDTWYNVRGWVESVSVPYFTGSKAYSVRDTNQPKTTTLYDDVGRPTKVTNPDGTFRTLGYSGWNLPNTAVTSTDERGFATTRTYDAFNRLSQVVEPTGGGTTTYSYDAFDFTGRNTQKITDTVLNIALKTEFDTLGRKVSDYDADRGNRSYTYDANGNVLTQTDAKNQKITYTYDALNRLKTKTYPDARVVTYNYDDATAGKYRIGRLWNVTDLSGATTTTFDQRGRQVQTDKVIGASAYTTKTTYDSLDRVVTLTYPDNEMVQNNYNAQGLLSQVRSLSFAQDYVTNINYNALSKVTSKTVGNGKVTTYGYYDPTVLNTPTSFHLRSIATPGLQDLAYTYDDAGNIKTIADVLKSGTQSFDYDALNRLGSASSAAATAFNHSYGYNAIGNLTSGAGTSFTFGPPGSARPHAPTGTTGGCSFGYDNNGNLTSNLCMLAGKYKYYAWDFDNRLTWSLSTESMANSWYTYDYAGNRVSRNENGVITQTPFPHYYVKGGAVTKYYFANGKRVAERTGPSATAVHYYHSDHLGSSNSVSDSAGAEIKATQFYPFGGTRSETGSKPLEHKYTGKDFDPATGLYYYGARYYDPGTMRFISADSIIPNRADPQSLNRYSYVRNNPLNRIDPSGMRDIFIGGAGDQCCSHIVQNYQGDLLKGRFESVYFSYSDQVAILAYANSVPLSEPLNIIGHSYGAHTAAQLASQINRPITALVTIDPVGVGSVAPFTNNVGVMINVELVPSNGDRSDFIAWLGNLLGGATPTSAANVNYMLNLHHSQFQTAMRTTSTDLGGNSPQTVIDNVNEYYPPPYPPDIDPDAYGDECDDC